MYIAVSSIEAIQSQLKNIYTNTLSTLCPLPWLEEAEDVQYKFDDVFIPLCTTNIDIQQKIDDVFGQPDRIHGQEHWQAENKSRPSGSRKRTYGQCSLYEPLGRNDVLRQTIDLSGPSDISNRRTHHTRYKSDKDILLSSTYICYESQTWIQHPQMKKNVVKVIYSPSVYSLPKICNNEMWIWS